MHEPVLVAEVLEFLNPAPGMRFLDCTLGEGGHAEKILERISPGGKLFGIDCDGESLAIAVERLERFGPLFQPLHANFAELANEAIGSFDGVLLDLGVSSLHLRNPARGFSFSADGPLDMRFDRSRGKSARDFVNTLAPRELEEILRTFGEERFARRIARAIVTARRKERIRTTLELARVVESVVPVVGRPRRIHPATRTFQALRILVNDELENLRGFLELVPAILNPDGRLVVISFHSLEDRIVKNSLRERERAGQVRTLAKKPVTPSEEEIFRNPRARSAKLRAAVRTSR